ncbi:MAG: putative permease [Desulfotomaculum sp. 46_296]|nr:MAG: putative permease [Desulfotomaculum sp. 46_296]
MKKLSQKSWGDKELILGLIKNVLFNAFEILNGASLWLVISFILAGLLHNLLSAGRLMDMLGNTKISSLIKATVSGMLLPICSCGVIPLGLGLYYSGACLGPTLAFMTATPIINPAAVLLAYGFLGPRIATVYLICGFMIPLIIGVAGNKFAGPELKAPGIDDAVEMVKLEDSQRSGLAEKLWSGLQWGFIDLGLTVSKYVCFGILLAGLIISFVPVAFIQKYLGNPGMLSIATIAVLGAVMYVCAVGHIPFIAALVASGAAPGLAITFLITGVATNLPELISIYKLIGKRAAVIYFSVLVGFSFLAGYLTNMLLMPDFIPFLDFKKTHGVVEMADGLTFSAPKPVKYLCTVCVLAMGLYAFYPSVKLFFKRCKAGFAQ